MSLKNKAAIVRIARVVLNIPVFPVGIIIVFVGFCWALLAKIKKYNGKPRLLWAATPIISLTYLSRALKQRGYVSEAAVIGDSPIYTKDNFDHILVVKSGCGRIVDWMLTNFRAYLFFGLALSRYDIFHYFFDGGILRRTFMARFELAILKLLNKKIIVMPYGGDAFVYDLIPNPIWRHGLLINYPALGDDAGSIQKRIRQMTRKADVVIGCLVHFVNLPRWDVLPLTCYPFDTQALQPVMPQVQGPIRIVHATNHRGIKGTEFLIAAVEKLRDEKFDVELDIIEKTPNTEALQRIAKADIYVDQLIFGYALAAMEGMALGKVVVTAIENSPEYDLFRQYSYLNECPAVPATTKTIYEVLKNLIQRRDEWQSLGKAGREFVEKRHSYAACAEMFEAIYQKIWHGDENVDLINFYHPLLEKKRLAQKKSS